MIDDRDDGDTDRNDDKKRREAMTRRGTRRETRRERYGDMTRRAMRDRFIITRHSMKLNRSPKTERIP